MSRMHFFMAFVMRRFIETTTWLVAQRGFGEIW